jgi:hypothetical protein
MGAFKTKINIYANIMLNDTIFNMFFIHTFLPYKFRYYKRRYYFRFFCGSNNVSITIFPNKIGNYICGQLYILYKESELSPAFIRTRKDNEARLRNLSYEY